MTWRLLFVDDVAEDVELATFELSHWEQPWVAQRVDNEAQLRAALIEFGPHVVLCDLHLPGFDGDAARAIVRAQAPSALFAFLTGAAAEMADTLDEPVWDKNHLEQLPRQLQALIEQGPPLGASPADPIQTAEIQADSIPAP